MRKWQKYSIYAGLRHFLPLRNTSLNGYLTNSLPIFMSFIAICWGCLIWQGLQALAGSQALGLDSGRAWGSLGVRQGAWAYPYKFLKKQKGSIDKIREYIKICYRIIYRACLPNVPSSELNSGNPVLKFFHKKQKRALRYALRYCNVTEALRFHN